MTRSLVPPSRPDESKLTSPHNSDNLKVFSKGPSAFNAAHFKKTNFFLPLVILSSFLTDQIDDVKRD